MMFVACGNKTGKTVSDTDSLAVDSINVPVIDKHPEVTGSKDSAEVDLLNIDEMPKTTVRQPDAHFQHAVDVPITQIASAEKAYIAPGDVSKVIVEGCPDGRNMWTYIIDPYKGTAKQLPSTEGVVTLEWEKKEIIASSYGYDDDGRYSVKKAYSLEGKFLRTVGNKERE